jgi:hypothetical protein
MSSLPSNPIYMGSPLDDGAPAFPPQFFQNNFVPAAAGHTAYKVIIQYRGITGIDVPPIAAALQSPPDQTYPLLPAQSQSFRTCSPSELKIVWWAAKRANGNLPALPHPQPSQNEILHKYWITAIGPELDMGGGGERAIVVEGVYVYKLLMPFQFGSSSSSPTDGFYLPIMVSDNALFGQFVLQQANFVPGILGYGYPQDPNASGVPPPAGFVTPSNPITGAEGVFSNPGNQGLTPAPNPGLTMPPPTQRVP